MCSTDLHPVEGHLRRGAGASFTVTSSSASSSSGPGADRFAPVARVGIAWLRGTPRR